LTRIVERLHQSIALHDDPRQFAHDLWRRQDLARGEDDVVVLHVDTAALLDVDDVVQLQTEELQQSLGGYADRFHRLHMQSHQAIGGGRYARRRRKRNVHTLVKLARHLQALTVRLDRQVPERRSFISKDMPVHQILQAGHVHRHLCGLKVQDVRLRVVEYRRRPLVAADHRPAKARDVKNDPVVDVQSDVLHLELNARGCEAQRCCARKSQHHGRAGGEGPRHGEFSRNPRAVSLDGSGWLLRPPVRR
jgi:hypothetical protein